MAHQFDHRFKILNVVLCIVHLISGTTALSLAASTAGFLAGSAGIVSSALHAAAGAFGITGRTNIYRYFPQKKNTTPTNHNSKKKQNRWIDYSISSTLMIAAIGLLSDIDTPMIIFISIFNSFSMVYSGYKEENATPCTFGWSCVIYTVTVWLPIFLTLKNPPEFVYAIISGLYVVYVSFAVIYALYSVYGAISTAAGEALYIVASLTAKLLLQWTIIGGAERNRSDGTVVYAVIASTMAAGIFVARPIVRYLTSAQYVLVES